MPLDLAQGREPSPRPRIGLKDKRTRNRRPAHVAHPARNWLNDFPQDVEKIHELKVSNPHFAKLMDEYHEINRAVHRAETGVEPCDQLAETAMRKERMRLKDEIAGMLAKA